MRRITTRIGLFRPGGTAKATGARVKAPDTPPGSPAQHLEHPPKEHEPESARTEKQGWLSKLLFGEEESGS
jgi:hypothetical protein